ncbi:hypothetical protein BASA83_007467 [Batrachochytrium salamandrivorans]|nr:hypothetical protein BASA83_007467 [Batrachochytrium salamandrivorans]
MESTSPDDPGAEDSLKYIITIYLIPVSLCMQTDMLPIDALNDMATPWWQSSIPRESYELSCSVVWPKYNEHYDTNFDDGYYNDVIKTVDTQISKAGLRVARWLNHLARLNPQTAVEAATPPLLSQKDPSMSSKKLASGAQKPDDPPPSSSDHDDHQVVDDADTEWRVVKNKRPRH